MKINTKGCLRKSCSYGDLHQNDTFVCDNFVYLKLFTGSIDLECACDAQFPDSQPVHKIELQVIHYEGVGV